MAKKIFKIFLQGFLKTLFVIACMIVCAVAGFFGTRYYYSQKNVSSVNKQSTASRDDVAKNLILVWNEEKQKISSCVLEIFDSESHALYFVTIPVNGQLTLSTEQYQKLSQISEEVPQVIRVSDFVKYFQTEEEAYGYGVLMLEECFGIDISYYTVVAKADFAACFGSQKVKSGRGKVDGKVLRDSYLKEMASRRDKDSIEEYLKEADKKIKSNLSTKDRLSYAKAYAGVEQNQIVYYALPTIKEGNSYTFDMEKCSTIFQKCNIDGSALTNGGDTAGDNGKKVELQNIVILNSTGTSGVAAKWSELFTSQGYQVKEIGNYSPELSGTRIVVAKDGQGEEFLDYFTNAEIRTGSLPEGAEAQIIIGKDDVKPPETE